MSPLPSDLRKTLENAVIAARHTAGQVGALIALAVVRSEPFPSIDTGQR